jgi:hypothetical protein
VLKISGILPVGQSVNQKIIIDILSQEKGKAPEKNSTPDFA